MKRCKECGKRVPPARMGEAPAHTGEARHRRRQRRQRNNQVNFACQALGYCHRCYRERFPKRPRWDLPPLRWGSEALLSYDDRRRLTRGGMTSEEMASALSREEELQELIRQQDFYDQWIDYLEHWQGGGEKECED